jgi:hypothetical protein
VDGEAEAAVIASKRVRLVALVAGLNLIAAVIYAVVAVRMGFFNHVYSTLFSSPDSNSYRDVADWLFGGPNSSQTTHRPFLYPLLLGVAQRIGGEWAIWLLNLVCWFGALNITTAATWRMTRSLVAAAIVFLVLATNVSIIVLTLQALTEPLTLLLEALWIGGLAWSLVPPKRPRDFVLLLLPITLLTVVKPGYQVEAVIGLILLGIAVLRMPVGRAMVVIAVAASCLPIAFQLALNAGANHFIGIASTGEIEFKDYYFAQVYAGLNGLPPDLTQARADVAPMTASQMLTYLIDHKQAAVRTLFDNFHGNLTSPSAFIDPGNNPTLYSVVRYMNRGYERLHVIFLPIVGLATWRRRDMRLLLLYSFAAVLILVPSLIYDQGDRYIDMAMPFWVVAYVVAIVNLAPFAARVVARFSQRAPA